MIKKSTNIINKIKKVVAAAGARKILVALSGGADSTALLCGLSMISPFLDIEIAAANCNFHLRGEESDRDSVFADTLCGRLGIPLHSIDFDAAEYAAQRKISIEMACRELRHGWFDKLMSEEGYERLATGHNESDNAETLLLNLLRGSGIAGLKGMTDDDGRVIRPLLHSSRREIVAFLQESGQDWVEDSTNAESDYRRNFLRNEIIPMLRTRWEGADRGLARSLEILGREHKIVEAAIARELQDCTTLLPLTTIRQFADPETLIFRFIRPYGGSSSMASEMAHAVEVSPPGSRWNLEGHYATLTSRGILIEKPGERPRVITRWTHHSLDGAEGENIRRRIRTAPLSEAWLPAGEESYEWRTPVAGDRISPIGMRGSKLVADLLKEHGLTPAARSLTLMLAEKRHDSEPGRIIWIPGIRRSRHQLISDNDKSVWHLTTELPSE